MSPLAPRPRGYDAVAARSAEVVIRAYSTSFGWASRLLPREQREHIRTIYALVRVADEVVDDPRPDWPLAERHRLLDSLEEETSRALHSGRSTNLVVHAFACTARRFGIDHELVTPFFSSMRADLTVREHDPASLAEYVYGSAEVVGLMCLRVFVAGDDTRYERLAPGASRLGAAFQKVNFLRDVAQDKDALGRSYVLPRKEFTDADRDALLDDIDADLRAAEAALVQLPAGSRRGVRAAHSLFSELSRRLRATPAEQIRTARIRVPDHVKARIIARALLTEGRR